jgi:hypothetical protein
VTRKIRRIKLLITLSVPLFALVSGLAGAADQTVLGKTFVVKDPQAGVDPSYRTVVARGKELLSDNAVVGDPVANGATVEIIANGASPTVQVFTLLPGAAVSGSPGWKTLGDPILGYSYKDGLGVNGPREGGGHQEDGQRDVPRQGDDQGRARARAAAAHHGHPAEPRDGRRHAVHDHRRRHLLRRLWRRGGGLRDERPERQSDQGLQDREQGHRPDNSLRDRRDPA